MIRSEDTNRLVALWFRVWALVRNLARQQTEFSVVSSVLFGVLVVTFLSDLLLGRPLHSSSETVSWLISFSLLALLPLIGGSLYPRWAGILSIAYLAGWSVYFVAFNHLRQSELNVYLELPMVALYLGWFYRRWISRTVMFSLLAAILVGLVLRPEQANNYFSSALAFAYAFGVSMLCLEAGSYLRRRSFRRANHDPLTGVLNRRGLADRAKRAIAAAHRTGSPLTLAVIDFDDFKAVNDSGGHAAGDLALCRTAATWRDGFGSEALVARTGGDEFVLLISADREDANRRLEELAAGAPYSWTWGLTQLRPGDSLDDLMLRADVRMYGAKGQRQSAP